MARRRPRRRRPRPRRLPPPSSLPQAPRSPPRQRPLRPRLPRLLSPLRARLLLRRQAPLRLRPPPLPQLLPQSPRLLLLRPLMRSPRRMRQFLWPRSGKPHRVCYNPRSPSHPSYLIDILQPLSLLVPLRPLPLPPSPLRHPRPTRLQPPRRSPPRQPPQSPQPLKHPLPSRPHSLLLACPPPAVPWTSLTLALRRSQSLPLLLRLLRRLPPVPRPLQPPHLLRSRKKEELPGEISCDLGIEGFARVEAERGSAFSFFP